METVSGAASSVARFYEGKTIFITGGTGFLGKVLVEKLLRSCPGIMKIYLLIRLKKGDDKHQRLAKLKDGMVFESLKSCPDQLNKLEAMEGDLKLPDLGLSEADRRLMQDVNIVFNMAATLNFNEDLRKSVIINVLATKALLEMCLSMKNLKSFVHVSTAYSNCERERIEERVYPASIDLEQFVLECQQCADEDLEALTTRILGNRPNTYIVTKALAENVVQEFAGRLPIAIARPSIVTASLKSPYPGWVDCMTGATGLLAVFGSGLLKVAHGNKTISFDIIPVDIVNNALIAIAWRTTLLGLTDPLVYNIVTGAANKVLLGEVIEYATIHARNIPQDTAAWYPSAYITQNRFVYNLGNFSLHKFPAYLHDYLVPSSGKLSLVRLHNSIEKALDALHYFYSRSFSFAYDNMPQLLEQMTEQDRTIFYCDVKKMSLCYINTKLFSLPPLLYFMGDITISQIDWFSYAGVCVLGVRKYLLKQSDETLPQAKKRMKILSMKHTAVKLAASVMAYYAAVTLATPYLVRYFLLDS